MDGLSVVAFRASIRSQTAQLSVLHLFRLQGLLQCEAESSGCVLWWKLILLHRRQTQRRLPPDRLAAAKAEFQTMLDAGTIRVSNSPWASSLLIVPKADGNFRPCGDYRQLNAVTQPDRFPIPHLHDFSANLNGATIFSKIDLTHAFHQIPMDESSIAKTAVTTPFGLFEFTTMPYGLRNAPQTFQRHMSNILSDLPFAYVYLDYVLIASTTPEQHKEHLTILFDRLCTHGDVYCDASNPRRIYLPATLRRTAIAKYHALSHPGIDRTLRLIAERYVWPSMPEDVKPYVQHCHDCQASKVTKHNRAALQACAFSGNKFDSVHLDLLGPLPQSRGHSYLLTLIDRFSRWIEVVPIPDIKSETVARAFVHSWVSRFGVPLNITHDRSAQFTSKLWTDISSLLGCSNISTTAFHPQSNGLIERVHRDLKNALKCLDSRQDWIDRLPIVLSFRSLYKQDQQATASEMMYGKTLRLPGDIVSPKFSKSFSLADRNSYAERLKDCMRQIQYVSPRTTNTSDGLDPALQNCTHVYVRVDGVKPALTRPYEGPFRVLKRTPKYIIIEKFGKHDSVSIDRLKTAYVSDAQVLAYPSQTTNPSMIRYPSTEPATYRPSFVSPLTASLPSKLPCNPLIIFNAPNPNSVAVAPARADAVPSTTPVTKPTLLSELNVKTRTLRCLQHNTRPAQVPATQQHNTRPAQVPATQQHNTRPAQVPATQQYNKTSSGACNTATQQDQFSRVVCGPCSVSGLCLCRKTAGSKPGNEYELFLVSRRELALIGHNRYQTTHLKDSLPHSVWHSGLVCSRQHSMKWYTASAVVVVLAVPLVVEALVAAPQHTPTIEGSLTNQARDSKLLTQLSLSNETAAEKTGRQSRIPSFDSAPTASPRRTSPASLRQFEFLTKTGEFYAGFFLCILSYVPGVGCPLFTGPLDSSIESAASAEGVRVASAVFEGKIN
ncbi:Integrase catalytic core, partial [Trinorchestia longiramus]